MDKEIIYYNSNRAAQPATLTLFDGKVKTLWVTADGIGFNEEHTARWKGCTHDQCTCGKWKIKQQTLCDRCSKESSDKRFQALASKKYDESPVCVWGDDTYFRSLDEIQDYCDDRNLRKEDLKLVFCEPNLPPKVSWDHFMDEVPDDSDGDVFSKEMIEAVENLNKIISEHKAISWSGGNVRVVFGKEAPNV